MLVYIDETGDHNLVKIDPQYPIFGLGALIISEENYSRMNQEINLIKSEFFGEGGAFILHSSELKRPLHNKSDERNKVMLDAEVRAKFYKTVDEKILEAFDFKIVACFVKKHAMRERYKYPMDPYYFAFENLLNRIIRYGNGNNVICAEKRGAQLDIELLFEYERFTKIGIHSFSSGEVKAKTSFGLVNKKDNVNGLQMIDLILSCLVRARQGKAKKMVGNDLSPHLIISKLACDPTIFPKKQ